MKGSDGMPPSTAKTPPKTTYYDLFSLRRDATAGMVEAAFRRFVARYRPMTPVAQLLTEKNFQKYLNAYLTLTGPWRADYDRALEALEAEDAPPHPEPLDALSALEKSMLTARMAFWRREMSDLLHLLRQITERNPQYAPAWALMGELYFTVDRLPEGIKAYEKAVACDADDAGYQARLQAARVAEAGGRSLPQELSPEEEMLREERAKRWRGALVFLVLGMAGLVVPACLRITAAHLAVLPLPLWHVLLQAGGAALLLFGLAFARILHPFEQVMLWSAMRASDRGRSRSYPYGLILFVTACASMWLSTLVLAIITLTDEDHPLTPWILLGLCLLANAGLVLNLYLHQLPWGTTAVFGGNLLVIAGMLGWWVGSIGAPTYS
jgi:tetratricopeptide (TPR) repeat protein